MGKTVSELVAAHESGTPWVNLLLNREISEAQVSLIDDPTLWYIASIGMKFSDSFILDYKENLNLHEVITRQTLKPHTVEQLWNADLCVSSLIIHQVLPKTLITKAIGVSPTLTTQFQKLGVDELLVNKNFLNFGLVVQYQVLEHHTLETLADELDWVLVYEKQVLSTDQKRQFRPRLLAAFRGEEEGWRTTLRYWKNLLTKRHLLK